MSINLGLDVGKLFGTVADTLVGAAKGGMGIADGVLDSPILNPLGAAIDGIGSAIGLPPEITDVAKVAAGIATGNPILVANGATGLGKELLENAPAFTEMWNGKLNAGIDDQGHGYLKYSESGKFSSLDVDMQFRNPIADLLRPRLPIDIFPMPVPRPGSGDRINPDSHLASDYGEYRDALQTLQANFDTFDTAGSINDGFFTRRDLGAIANNRNASPELREAAQFFLDHPEYFNRLEMSVGWDHQDGRVGLGDINKELSQVNSEIRRHGLPPSGEASRPEPGQPGGIDNGQPVSGGASKEIAGILGDPNLSLEEKIMLILSMIMDKVDKEMESVAAELGNTSDQRSAATTQKTDPKDEAATRKREDEVRKLDTAMEKMQLRMQTLMEKRKQMFEMMSNMSTKFHEMSKTAIQNMARA